jgi:micrococcal nuclease
MVVSIALLVVACNTANQPTAGVVSVAGAPERATVSRVIDGDTIELEGGERVRYLGIDTPETVHPDKSVECYGPEAAVRNRALVEGKAVELLSDGPDRDAYGRLLRYVFVDGIFVNGDLVWGGYAFARSYGDPPRLYETLLQLQRAARESQRGLWKACER